MSFLAPRDRLILSVLKHLEFDGCPSATGNGKPTTPNLKFGVGVPAVLLKACVPDHEPDLTKNLQLLLRRKMIREARLKWWWLGGETRLLLDQDVVIIQAWQGGFSSLARQMEEDRFEPAGGVLPKYPGTGMGLKVFIGRQRGKHLINARVFPAWHAEDWGPVYSIEAAGLEALEAPAPARSGRGRSERGQEKWRAAQRAMLNELKRNRLPSSVRRTARQLGFANTTCLTAVRNSPSLQDHFRLHGARPNTSSKQFDEMIAQAEPETRRSLEHLSPEERAAAEQALRRLAPDKRAELAQVLRGACGAGRARVFSHLDSSDRDARRRE